MKATSRPLSAQNPWPGPPAYDEASSGYFFGREDEARELLRLLSLSRLVALYGKSGLGKSSLLMAGLFPKLREGNALPVWVRLDFSPDAKPVSEQIALRLETELTAFRARFEPRRPGESLWQFLHRAELTFWLPGLQPAEPVFVLDQLEELFSIGARDLVRQQEVLAELTSLFENLEPPAATRGGLTPAASRLDPTAHRYRVLVAFREDYLPDFKAFSARSPSLLQRELRLLPMSREKAIRAVTKAGAAVLAEDADDAASAIVDFVGNVEGASTPSGEIEPALLSLCAFRLVQSRGKRRIDRAMVEASAPNIFEQYYLEAVVGMPRAAAFIEDHLIVGERFRGSYPLQQAIDDGLLTKDQLARLTDEFRVLRIDPYGSTPRIELIHDRMVAPVRAAREARLRHLTRASTERERQQSLTEIERQRVGNPQAITFRVFGQLSGHAGGMTVPWSAEGVSRAVRLAARGTQGPQSVQLTALPGEDVVILRLRGGPTLVLHPETTRDLLQGTPSPNELGGGAHSLDVLDTRLTWRNLSVGAEPDHGYAGDVLLVGLEIFTSPARVAPTDSVCESAIARLDGRTEAGLYLLQPGAPITLMRNSGREHDAGRGPILVLIHGAFVDTASTFAPLWSLSPHRVRELVTRYDGRVYAMEHPTLATCPVANALQLVEWLPEDAHVHLLTHGRGGLVAEIVARVAENPELAPQDLHFFRGAANDRQRATLQQLTKRVKERGIRVERIVRIACPTRGSLLASGRVDAYLSVLVWMLGQQDTPVPPELADLLLEVAKHRVDPRAWPGLAAMLPDSPLVQWLNSSTPAIAGDLRVIAADLYGDAAGRWAKTLLADNPLRPTGDMLVATDSMYGGAPRAGGASYLLRRGGVSHFGYFSDARTVDAAVSALVADEPAGFRPIGGLSWARRESGPSRATVRRGRAGPPDARAAVFLLPDLFGSHLAVNGHRIWLGPRLMGGVTQLAWHDKAKDRVTPDGLVESMYGGLADHLARTHEVLAFDFDWRRPLEDEARRLAEQVVAALDARVSSNLPVRLLAHGMGGLLARTMQLERPEVWKRLMVHPGARLVMLGTPNAGSWTPMQLLSGDDPLSESLAACAAPMQEQQFRQILASMPGVMQLQAGLGDPQLGTATAWHRLAELDSGFRRLTRGWHRDAGQLQTLAWGTPPQVVLDRAVNLRRRLDHQVEADLPAFADRLRLIVGQARSTPDGYSLDDGRLSYLDANEHGDGRVTHESAMLPGVSRWWVDRPHHELTRSNEVFVAAEELLRDGDTDRLTKRQDGDGSTTKATPLGGRATRLVLTGAAPAGGEQSLLQSADPWYASAAPTSPGTAFRVAVVNGILDLASAPLMVGHYRSLALSGTEAMLDRHLGGAMSAALSASLYPDAEGTHQVFVNTRGDPGNPWQTPRPPAVIVVGLGEERDLGLFGLIASVRQSVIAWMQRLAEAGGAAATFELASTLIGSGGPGISVGTSARAIVLGVREANERAASLGWPEVEKVSLIELYLDRASEALGNLRVQAETTPGQFIVEPTVQFGAGALRRTASTGYRGVAYDLIRVQSSSDSTLTFDLDTSRLRAEARVGETQATLTRELVRHASQQAHDDMEIGRTLFQLLVPAEMEQLLSSTAPTVVELDVANSSIPWELLQLPAERQLDGDPRPWAVRTRLLRRLRLLPYFGASPRDADASDGVLVIGEPRTGPDYGPLPGARAEAHAVAETLRSAGGLKAELVAELVNGPDAASIVSTLMSRSWRIVHVAGHGEAGHDGGIALSDGLFLGPREIAVMRTVPELVFVNGCHRPTTPAPRHDPPLGVFAAGMAAELIRLGVRCVVAAGWSVEDEPARVFAKRLYRELLDGQRFVDAVAAAREATWAEGGNTWAAYQCYGDPDWRFRHSIGDAPALTFDPSREFTGIVSPVDLAHALENLTNRSRFMAARPSAIAEQIRQLEGRFGGLWGAMGAVAEAFGVAYEAASDFASAVAWYRRAVVSDDGSASLKASEQLGNLRVRVAYRSLLDSADTVLQGQAAEELDDATEQLSMLARLHPTIARHSLCGAAWKRRAMAYQRAGDDVRAAEATRQSASSYGAAEAMATAAGDPNLFYPAFNRMAAELVMHASNPSWTGFDGRSLDAARRALQSQAASAPDFWNLVGLVELDLYEALAARDLPSRLPPLTARFEDLHARVPNPSLWTAVADQAAFTLPAFERTRDPSTAAAARALRLRLESYASP